MLIWCAIVQQIKQAWVHTYNDPSNPLGGFTNTPAANYKVGLYGAAGGNPLTGFTVGGQTYARKAIYMERLLELGMEGHRFFDLPTLGRYLWRSGR